MWDVGAANNSRIEDDHFISVIKIKLSGMNSVFFAVQKPQSPVLARSLGVLQKRRFDLNRHNFLI
jgi:hypothetical protein